MRIVERIGIKPARTRVINGHGDLHEQRRQRRRHRENARQPLPNESASQNRLVQVVVKHVVGIEDGLGCAEKCLGRRMRKMPFDDQAHHDVRPEGRIERIDRGRPHFSVVVHFSDEMLRIMLCRIESTQAGRVSLGIRRRVPFGNAIGIVDLMPAKPTHRGGKIIAETFAHGPGFRSRSIIGHLIVLHGMTVFVHDHVRVLRIIHAPLPVVDDEFGGVIKRIVRLLTVADDFLPASIRVENSERLNSRLRAIEMIIRIGLLEPGLSPRVGKHQRGTVRPLIDVFRMRVDPGPARKTGSIEVRERHGKPRGIERRRRRIAAIDEGEYARRRERIRIIHERRAIDVFDSVLGRQDVARCGIHEHFPRRGSLRRDAHTISDARRFTTNTS